jgi:hypothetical protein
MPRRQRKRPPQFQRPRLYIEQILRWADAHFARTGRWPNINSGRIPESFDDTWKRIDDSLRSGHRGLPKNSGWTLARLLNESRGVRNSEYPPPLTEAKIVKWARAHFRRTGRWPTDTSGPIEDAPGETWLAIDMALRKGKRRGLPGGSSLAKLLAKHGLRRNPAGLSRLTVRQILRWADAHHRRTRMWPNQNSGPVVDAPGEHWSAINSALINGRRGLPGGSSLTKLVAQHRGVRRRTLRPELSFALIQKWAAAHRRRTGTPPTKRSGRVVGATRETWGGIDSALRTGSRGLPGNLTLAQLLANGDKSR